LKTDLINSEELYMSYYNKINELITKSKHNIIRNFNSEMVELYFEIGATINELIESYNLESSQNEIIKRFSQKLTKEFGQGFSVPSLKKMKKFYLTYKGGSTLWNQLSWSHNRLIINIDDEGKRNFYFKSNAMGCQILGGVVSFSDHINNIFSISYRFYLKLLKY